MSSRKNKQPKFQMTNAQRKRRVNLAIAIWDEMVALRPRIPEPSMTQIYDQLLIPWDQIETITTCDKDVTYRIPAKLLSD